jgi:putative ABC transport system substrate-binding protein
MFDAFARGMLDLGYIPGKHIVLDNRSAQGVVERLDAEAAAMVRSGVSVIVVSGVVAARACLRATQSIPIVLAPAGDPVRTGLAASLASSGSNITGVSLFAFELNLKRLEVLKEAIPSAVHVGVLANTPNASHDAYWHDSQPVSEKLGLRLRQFRVSSIDDLERAFPAPGEIDALVVPPDADFDAARNLLIRLAAERAIPTVYEHRAFAEAGGLISYGPNVTGMSYRAAAYVDKLLNGAKAHELPIEQPTRFELVVNARTAATLGVILPPAFVARADEVIE